MSGGLPRRSAYQYIICGNYVNTAYVITPKRHLLKEKLWDRQINRRFGCTRDNVFYTPPPKKIKSDTFFPKPCFLRPKICFLQKQFLVVKNRVWGEKSFQFFGVFFVQFGGGGGNKKIILKTF